MGVRFENSFFESVEKLVYYDTKLYKVWEFIKRGLPNFLKNIWRFRKELYSHNWWDYRFTLEMMYRSLSIMEKGISEKGIEVDESRIPKVKAMRRALELLKHNLDDTYIDMAEAELGKMIMHDWEFERIEGTSSYQIIDKETDEERVHNKRVFDRAHEIEEAEWKELWKILKGGKNGGMRGWWD